MQVLDLVPCGRTDGDPRKVKVEAAGGCLPPRRSRLRKILDEDLPRLDDGRVFATAKLVPNLRSQHQREAHHIQSVAGVLALLSAELHRAGGKVGKPARGST